MHACMYTEEFYAHSDVINCVSIGRQSAHVIATGGKCAAIEVSGWRGGEEDQE